MAKGTTSNPTARVAPPPPDEVDEEGSEYSSSEEDVTEDEDGLELTPALDAAILRTLGKIRRKEGVYGSEKVLEEELGRAEQAAQKKGITGKVPSRTTEKPFRLADHHRMALLSGKTRDDDEELVTHVESQYRLKREAVEAFKSFADDEDDEDFAPVKKEGADNDEDEAEDEEYRKFLLEMGGGEAEVRKLLGTDGTESGLGEETRELEVKVKEKGAPGKEKKPSREGKAAIAEEKKSVKAKADGDFLMNYILNRGWIDKSASKLPTYDDIVGRGASDDEGDGFNGDEAGPSHPWGKLDEEDEFDDKADEFEAAYNFRFEEPGASNIMSHPRDIPSLVRRADDTRKSKRAARAERKAAEQAARDEEMRRRKGEKRREMDSRLASLKKDVGDGVDWGEVVKLLEGNYDERDWDRVVGGMLSHMKDIEDDEADEEKPTWDDIGDAEYDEMEQEPFEEGGEYDMGMAEDDDRPINMDADFIELGSIKKRRRSDKGKHRDEAAPEIADEGLSMAEKAQKVKQAMGEYKALDHEDMIGDMPTRFKYTRSAPSSFGLTPVEILLATDAELNSLVSVKHIAPYRQGGLGTAGRGLGKRVRDLKDDLRKRRWGEEYRAPRDQHGKGGKERARDSGWPKKVAGDEEDGENKRKGKRMGKKERMKAKLAEGGLGAEQSEAANPVNSTTGEKRKSHPEAEVLLPNVSGGEGGEAKKKRRKKKHGQQSGGELAVHE